MSETRSIHLFQKRNHREEDLVQPEEPQRAGRRKDRSEPSQEHPATDGEYRFFWQRFLRVT